MQRQAGQSKADEKAREIPALKGGRRQRKADEKGLASLGYYVQRPDTCYRSRDREQGPRESRSPQEHQNDDHHFRCHL